jgi:hypothetical protein
MKRICTLLISCFFVTQSIAQIEVDYVKLKDFSAVGFGGFLNFAIPVGESDFATVEGGVQFFTNKYTEELYLLPVIAGYRYTLDRSGYGFYAEPNAGYTFGGSTIMVYDEQGSPLSDGDDWLYRKPAGPTAGIAFGYLFDPGGKIQLNLALRYQRGFGTDGTNVFSFRVSHAITFGRKQ